MKRRDFLKGSVLILGAPAIVKAENLMKIWTPPKHKYYSSCAGGITWVDSVWVDSVYDERLLDNYSLVVKDFVSDGVYIQETATNKVFKLVTLSALESV